MWDFYCSEAVQWGEEGEWGAACGPLFGVECGDFGQILGLKRGCCKGSSEAWSADARTERLKVSPGSQGSRCA